MLALHPVYSRTKAAIPLQHCATHRVSLCSQLTILGFQDQLTNFFAGIFNSKEMVRSNLQVLSTFVFTSLCRLLKKKLQRGFMNTLAINLIFEQHEPHGASLRGFFLSRSIFTLRLSLSSNESVIWHKLHPPRPVKNPVKFKLCLKLATHRIFRTTELQDWSAPAVHAKQRIIETLRRIAVTLR